MPRLGFLLLVGLSLASVAGYSSCPCDGLLGVESLQKAYLDLAEPNLYETKVLDLGNRSAVGTISGGDNQNVLQVFTNPANDGFYLNPEAQTFCTGACYGLTVAMDAPCFGYMKGSKANVACFLQNSWTNNEVPGDYANLTLAGNSRELWGAYYNPSAGSYDFKKWSYGGSWESAFTYKAAGIHWDAPFGSISAALCATETDLVFAHDSIFTGQLNYEVTRLGFDGAVGWNTNLYRGSTPTGPNHYYRSTISDRGGNIFGAFYVPPTGLNRPGAGAYSVDGASGSLNYSQVFLQYDTPLTKTPDINLLLTDDPKGGTIANVIVPTWDRHFNWSQIRSNGNASTSQFRKQWDQTPWAGIKMLGNGRYLGAGSFTIPSTGSQLRPADSTQAEGATLTVELLTLGSFLNFAQFADGGGLSSQVILTNTGSEEETVTLHLRDSGGAGLGFNVANDGITIPGTQNSGQYEITIPAYGVRSLRTDGGGDVVVGSARVEASSSISGVIAFGGAFGLAGVGNSTALFRGFTAPMETDSGGGLNTGVAVMNLADSETVLEAELYTETGELLSTAEPITLPPLGQKALFVDQFAWQTAVDFAKFRGLLKVTATGRTGATVLQSRPSQLATMPVTPL